MPVHKFNNPGLVYYKALSKYLELVKDIPEVVEVRLSEDDTLCTIISADPVDNSPRYKVFDAQAAMMRAVDPQPFDFRLLNCQSLAAEKRDDYILRQGDLIWIR